MPPKQPTKTVEGYLAALPPEVKAALESLRSMIRKIVPDAVEVISYQIPTFRHEGRMLVGYAAFASHCSFFIMSTAATEALQDELKGYETAKSTVHFTPGKPLPEALVTKIVRHRIEENRAK